MQGEQIFSGWVRHRRFRPHGHEFTYDTRMVLLDVTNPEPTLDRSRWWSSGGFKPIQFRETDYLPIEPNGGGVSLAERARRQASSQGAADVAGKVLLLAQLRHWGYSFNPVVFFFLHDRKGQLSAIGAEITNTPWDERHAYWLPVAESEGAAAGTGRGDVTAL